MMITIHDVEQGSPEWQALRLRHPFTGSGADKLLRFGTVEYSKNVESTFRGNFHTRRGHILEDEAIELYEEITGHAVSRLGFVTNSKYPLCGYSPDGYDDALGIPLEVKAFAPAKHMAMLKGYVPMKVLAQIHYGQFLWEKKGARLLVYNPDLDDPKLCLGIINVRYDRDINNNFKRILTPQKATS